MNDVVRSALQNKKHNRHIIRTAAGDDEQMPDAMCVPEADIEDVEDDAHRVENPARCNPGKTGAQCLFQRQQCGQCGNLPKLLRAIE